MKAEKAAKYKEFKQSNDKKKFEEWFLNYKPDDVNKKKTENIASNKSNTKVKTKKAKKVRKQLVNIYGK